MEGEQIIYSLIELCCLLYKNKTPGYKNKKSIFKEKKSYWFHTAEVYTLPKPNGTGIYK